MQTKLLKKIDATLRFVTLGLSLSQRQLFVGYMSSTTPPSSADSLSENFLSSVYDVGMPKLFLLLSELVTFPSDSALFERIDSAEAGSTMPLVLPERSSELETIN